MERRPHTVEFIFDERLLHFLKAPIKSREQAYTFDGTPSLKDAIEAQGIPHTEIALIVCGETTKESNELLKPNQCYQVLAPGSEFNGIRLLPEIPPHGIKFILDINLGKLTRYMRLLGFDTRMPKEKIDDPYLASESAKEDRILLTRDRGLLKRSIVKYGYWVRNHDPLKQIEEVIRYYSLQEHCAPFTRCIKCNGCLNPVEKNQIVNKIPKPVAREHSVFKQCEQCESIYWKGSHVQNMLDVINAVS